jgi:hypothetical protein
MQEIVPDLIEQVPIIKGTKCKILLVLVYIFISYGPTMAGFVLWYMYDFFIAIAFFLFFTLSMGVVMSKMRLFSLPATQREMTYSNLQVAKWFVSKNICWRL